MAEALLPASALKGKRVAISVSDSTDLARLGLDATHLCLAVGEVARAVLVGGGQLAYGGHLEPTGFTTFLAGEVQRYGKRTDRPLLICLAWQEHRKLKLSELETRKKALGLYGKIVCLDPDGVEVNHADGRGEPAVAVDDAQIRRQSLTSLRRYMRTQTHGRVVIGGKRRDFQGELPGLMEEVLLALEGPSQPVYLAGGFGGATADIVRALGVDELEWFSAVSGAPADDPRLIKGRERLQALREAEGWRGLDNGLRDPEQKRLASTHRPSEVASLVTLGLGRKFAGLR